MKVFAQGLAHFAIFLGTFCAMRSAAIFLGWSSATFHTEIFLFCFVIGLTIIFVEKRLDKNSIALYLPVSIPGKALQTLRFIATIFAVSLFLYGIIRYPSAPIRPDGNGNYISKRKGKYYTRAQYLAFMRWESALTTAWPGMLMLFFGADMLLRKSKKQKSKKRK